MHGGCAENAEIRRELCVLVRTVGPKASVRSPESMTAAGPASKCLAAGGSAPSAPADSELIGIFKAAAAGVGAGDDPRCARCSMAHDNLPIHAQRYSINCGCCSWTGRPSFMVLDRNAKYRCWTLDRRRLRRPERIALEVGGSDCGRQQQGRNARRMVKRL